MRAAIAGCVLPLALAIGMALGRCTAPIPRWYVEVPPGIVMGAADLTFDKGATRTYRLVIMGDTDRLPYTVTVDLPTYTRFTRTLGQRWR